MPVGHIAPGASSNIEQVRLVCNRWGHCWRTGPSYGYRAYGWDRGYHRGWRHHRNWR
jgi:hypothetical protein